MMQEIRGVFLLMMLGDASQLHSRIGRKLKSGSQLIQIFLVDRTFSILARIFIDSYVWTAVSR
jgi:hypothetical protein